MIRAFRRQYGLSTRQVAVRAHYPWYLRWTILIFVICANAALIWGAFMLGQGIGGGYQTDAGSELQRLGKTSGRLADENDKLRDSAASYDRRLQIEHATASDLAKQVQAIALENATLKEDLAVFKALMSPPGKDASINVNRFRVERDAMPGEYRYRLLLTQSGQRLREFQGSLKFVVSLQQEGKKVVMVMPMDDDKAQNIHLNFKFYQRIEGSFKVEPNAIVDSLQVRVFENGATEPRLTETANLS